MAVLAGVLGLLVGSFSNVLIYRLPRRENIAFPPSHCTNCNHQLGALDLVPVFSWLALRGKCRYCGAPIRVRYPLVELATGALYALMAVVFPFSAVGASLLGLLVLMTLLLVASMIDADTRTIPDSLTLPGAALGLAFAVLNERTGASSAGLPSFPEALRGMLLGAGVLMLIDLLGSWVLRRFRERQYPDFPIGYQQVALATLVGAWGGVWWGVAAALASTAVNVVARRVVRVPDLLTLGGLLVSVAVASTGVGPGLILMVQNALAATGAAALIAGAYWWTQPEPADTGDDDAFDASAMGFGDVKLAAVIGAFLGWEQFLVALVVAVLAGAVLGVVQLAIWRENRLKFGPYLAIGALVALLFGQQLIHAYMNKLGL
ncbi:Prepilin peptidase [Deinococcus maricopensis DSM 21211]|uniref:Prepilin peptidase n=2 Tax=Deinococcus TaxID=1298 RepID=E8U5V5_DEIML|nr:Prepilin peptidase [Deinococcus maricopensis DSM 21211]